MLLSCSEENAIKTEYIYLEKETLNWFPQFVDNEVFTTKDLNNITQTYKKLYESYHISPSTSSFFGINTKTIYTEEYYMTFRSTYNDIFSVDLQSYPEERGDVISLTLNDLQFQFSFKLNNLTNINLDTSYLSDYVFEDEYDNLKIKSKVDFFEDYNIYDTINAKVLHFKLLDFQDYLTEFTPIEIFFSQKYGLIKYILQNGNEYKTVF